MTVDLAIVGAGPAGMAAAVLASELGLDTVLIDEQEGPGGQIYRGVERGAREADRGSPLGRDYLAGRPLAAALRESPVDYRPAHIDLPTLRTMYASAHWVSRLVPTASRATASARTRRCGWCCPTVSMATTSRVSPRP